MNWICETCVVESKKKGKHRRHLTCQKKASLAFKVKECECPCRLDEKRKAWS